MAAPIHRREARSCHSRDETRGRSSGSRRRSRRKSLRWCSATLPITKTVGAGRWASPRASSASARRGHFGVLHQAELILQPGEAAGVAVGTPAVELAGEFQRVAQALAADPDPVEVRRDAGALGRDGPPS